MPIFYVEFYIYVLEIIRPFFFFLILLGLGIKVTSFIAQGVFHLFLWSGIV